MTGTRVDRAKSLLPSFWYLSPFSLLFFKLLHPHSPKLLSPTLVRLIYVSPSLSSEGFFIPPSKPRTLRRSTVLIGQRAEKETSSGNKTRKIIFAATVGRLVGLFFALRSSIFSHGWINEDELLDYLGLWYWSFEAIKNQSISKLPNLRFPTIYMRLPFGYWSFDKAWSMFVNNNSSVLLKSCGDFTLWACDTVLAAVISHCFYLVFFIIESYQNFQNSSSSSFISRLWFVYNKIEINEFGKKKLFYSVVIDTIFWDNLENLNKN